MKKESLKSYYDRERKSDSFEPLPFYYREISKILLTCKECFSNDLSDELSILIQDIEDIRNNKLRNGLKMIDHESTLVHLHNIAAIEISSIRQNACKLLDYFHVLKNAKGGKFSDYKNNNNDDNDNDEKQRERHHSEMYTPIQSQTQMNSQSELRRQSGSRINTPLSNISNFQSHSHSHSNSYSSNNNNRHKARSKRNIIPTEYVSKNRRRINNNNNNNNNNSNDNKYYNGYNENSGNNRNNMDSEMESQDTDSTQRLRNFPNMNDLQDTQNTEDTQDTQQRDFNDDDQFGVKQRSLRRMRN